MAECRVEKTELDGVMLVSPPTQHEDFRGTYVEIYNEELYTKAGIKNKFLQDDYSRSSQYVLRGIHGDGVTTKLISCIYGVLYVLVVNNDPESAQYRKWKSFTISDQNRLQILIPPKFGNSFVVMSPMAIFHYKQDTLYNRSGQFTIKWNDPSYDFWWPIHNPILSERDF